MAKKKNPIPFDGQGREIFHALLSYLIGDVDATQLLWDTPLTDLVLPDEMEFEKLTIDSIYTLIANGANPTFGAVAGRLRIRYQIDDAAEKLGQIYSLRQLTETSDFQGVVRQAYGNFLTWWDDTMFGYTLQRALDVWNRPSGLTSGERRDEILHMVQAASPNSKTFDSYRNELEAYRAFMKAHQARVEKGASAYPKFPFSKLNEQLGSLFPGNPMLISAATKRGKSLMSAVLAEWFAYTQGLYVLMITLESDVEQWERRWWARHFGIPQNAWLGDVRFTIGDGSNKFERVVPQIDMRNPYWAELVSEQRVTEYLSLLNVAGGRLVLERTPGWSITALKKRVMEHLRVSERLGMPLLVLVDYIQKSAWMNLGKERELDLITRYSNDWKLLAEKTQMYSIMFSQESGDAADGVKGYGSRIPHTVFQQYTSIQRPQLGSKKPPVSVIEEPVILGNDRLFDAFKRQRFYARTEGDFSGKHAYLDIVAANDGGRGKVPILIEGAHSNITDPEAPQFIQNHSGERIENPWAVRRYAPVDFSRFFLSNTHNHQQMKTRRNSKSISSHLRSTL